MKVSFMWDYIQPCEAQLTVFFSVEALLRYADRHGLDGWKELFHVDDHDKYNTTESACFLSCDDDKFIYVMLLPAHYAESTVWHECLHCAIRVWEHAGANLDLATNEEVLTYTQGHIAQVVRNMYERKEEIENGNSN